MKARRTREDDVKHVVNNRMRASHEDGIQKIKVSKKGLKMGLTSDLLAIMGGTGQNDNGMREIGIWVPLGTLKFRLSLIPLSH
jgi:hypothetical protein